MNNDNYKSSFVAYLNKNLLDNKDNSLKNNTLVTPELVNKLEIDFLKEYEKKRKYLFTKTINFKRNNHYNNTYINNINKSESINLNKNSNTFNIFKNFNKDITLISSYLKEIFNLKNHSDIEDFDDKLLFDYNDIKYIDDFKIYESFKWLKMNPYITNEDVKTIEIIEKKIRQKFFIYFCISYTAFNTVLGCYIYYRRPNKYKLYITCAFSMIYGALNFKIINKPTIKYYYINELKKNYVNFERLYYKQYDI